MPNHSGPHYFLTLLAPVRREAMRRADGTVTSPVNALREVLASLPTARQSAASAASPVASPFSRNTLNHFVRLAVIGDAAYNGRDRSDAILDAVAHVDPAIVKRPADHLSHAWLLVTADIDASGDGEAALRAWLDALWATMQTELRAIFCYCVGFEAVNGAAAFAAWIRRCQVETTMPFNDYQVSGAPGDLPGVLKSLYLQRNFTRFAIDGQGATPEELHRRFGDFIAAHAPDAPTPTQPPGMIGG